MEIDLWIIVDEDANFVFGQTIDEAAERYSEDIGNGDDSAKRQIKITLRVPLPCPVELTGTVPEESKEGKLTVSLDSETVEA